jgi:hypothetical protein
MCCLASVRKCECSLSGKLLGDQATQQAFAECAVSVSSTKLLRARIADKVRVGIPALNLCCTGCRFPFCITMWHALQVLIAADCRRQSEPIHALPAPFTALYSGTKLQCWYYTKHTLCALLENNVLYAVLDRAQGTRRVVNTLPSYRS